MTSMGSIRHTPDNGSTIADGPACGMPWQRAASAVSRRARWYWQRLTRRAPQQAVEAALSWLLEQGRDGGVGPRGGWSAPCPGLTGACLTTLFDYGQDDLARDSLDWLLEIQRDDGAITDAGLAHPSLFNTGQVARGLLAWVDQLPELEEPLARAGRYLASRIDADGALRVPDDGGSFDRWAPPIVNLACLPALLATARRLDEPAWESAVWRAVRHVQRGCDLGRWNASVRILAHGVHALVDLGWAEAAHQAIGLFNAAQRRNGAVPAELAGSWVSSPGLAHLAVIWYKLGERQRADRAMAYLRAHQRSGGGFLGSWGRGAGYYPQHEVSWTAKYFLDAALLQVAAAFEEWRPGAADRLVVGDPRLAAVRRWAAQLPPGARVADVGCGPGRYLEHLAHCAPSATLTGIDANAALLSQLPAGVNRQAGSLLRIPARDGAFDAVLCVEALEHSLTPRRALAELCRVLRPGGSLLLIDKNRQRQPLAHHEPWEQWFDAHEMIDWLLPACEDVQVTPLEVPGVSGSAPVYFAWHATRRAAGKIRRAA